jgi:hyperosmotically inducible protein
MQQFEGHAAIIADLSGSSDERMGAAPMGRGPPGRYGGGRRIRRLGPEETAMNRTKLSTLAGLLAAVALAACEQRDPPQPKVEPDNSLAAKAERKIDEVRADAKREYAEAREKAREIGQEAKVGGEQASADVKQAADVAGDKVADAAITATVNAELAKDTHLSATKIDVDTAAGNVALRGVAPSAAARERATQLAAHVKGVRSVDNQLVVEPARM